MLIFCFEENDKSRFRHVSVTFFRLNFRCLVRLGTFIKISQYSQTRQKPHYLELQPRLPKRAFFRVVSSLSTRTTLVVSSLSTRPRFQIVSLSEIKISKTLGLWLGLGDLNYKEENREKVR